MDNSVFFLQCGKILVLVKNVQPITFYCRNYGYSNCTKFMSVHLFKDISGWNVEMLTLCSCLGWAILMFIVNKASLIVTNLYLKHYLLQHVRDNCTFNISSYSFFMKTSSPSNQIETNQKHSSAPVKDSICNVIWHKNHRISVMAMDRFSTRLYHYR